ncbi:GNAT family N-acetyltransferase [Neobacillus sp. LXY-4]|uniref:GNAT family N-acetyltransferase n=1 Tax=Neobacillus sp. LXY-4 TaxID=3379826 RepID=UPI003EE14D83
MGIRLEKAEEADAEAIFDIQVKAFMPLLVKYQDHQISPANETIDKVKERIKNPNGGFYKILFEDSLVGAICIYWRENLQFRISPMFIVPKYQGKKIAQNAILLIEEMFSEARSWELATILEEERNCYLYEKMGYIKTGLLKKINDKTTLVFYKKIL